ncbi:DUF1428 domain-containing protein [Paracoccus sp. M683]|uniref:DUF1428 domain-containing protein n=1 Tax=Paracoccus sp. M683 TaxID=2594268 RepID=UPI00117D17F5|nr:DUF1428 domain-containing protein [Paracoccus sp. M683]TRW98170.1 DUF1428 domain-containing protein [Paracoccus sp. M683]
MSYYFGMIAAVPTANKQKYINHLKEAWGLIGKYGATRMIETWGVDVPSGKVNDLLGAVEAKDDETVVFSWTEWPDKATADAGWEQMRNDPAMAAMGDMPFDGSRMIFGGFQPVWEAGQPSGAPYYQGFALAAPEKNKAAYAKMAGDAWSMFEGYGALGTVEGWGVDVPHGKKTDFYRATLAEEGEAPIFSWIAWPDRATCDAAAKSMEADMEGQEFPEMPFDGKRMMWGGFETIFDSKDA